MIVLLAQALSSRYQRNIIPILACSMSAFASLAEHYSAIPITRGVWWHGVSLWCLGVYLSVEAIGGGYYTTLGELGSHRHGRGGARWGDFIVKTEPPSEHRG